MTRDPRACQGPSEADPVRYQVRPSRDRDAPGSELRAPVMATPDRLAGTNRHVGACLYQDPAIGYRPGRARLTLPPTVANRQGHYLRQEVRQSISIFAAARQVSPPPVSAPAPRGGAVAADGWQDPGAGRGSAHPGTAHRFR
jgi:hypothetical protein